MRDGARREWRGERVSGVNAHGSGCALSSAIAAGLARGRDLETACDEAHAFLAAAFRNPDRLESGTELLGVNRKS